MKIVEYEIGKIKPAEYNPRTFSEREYKSLYNSIEKFGLVDPLIINAKNGRKNVLVGGHLRLKALKELGWKKVPCVEVKLDKATEMALNVALNSHTVQGKFDVEMLPTVLEEILDELPEMGDLLALDQLEKDLKLNFEEVELEIKEKELDENKAVCPECGQVIKS